MDRLALIAALALTLLTVACGGTERERPSSTDLCPQCDSPADLCDRCPYPGERDDWTAWGPHQVCIDRYGPPAIVCWRSCLGVDSSTVTAVNDWVVLESDWSMLRSRGDAEDPGQCDLPNNGF